MDILIKRKVHSVLLFSPKSGTEVLSWSEKQDQKKKKKKSVIFQMYGTYILSQTETEFGYIQYKLVFAFT